MLLRHLLDRFDDPNIVPNESLLSRAQRLRTLADRLSLEHVTLKAQAFAAVQEARACRRAAFEARAWFEDLVTRGNPERRKTPPPPPPRDQDDDTDMDENPLDVILRRLRAGDHELAHQVLGPEGRTLTERLYEMPEVEELFRPRRVNAVHAGRQVEVMRGGIGALRERLVRAARAALRGPPDDGIWRHTRPDTP